MPFDFRHWLALACLLPALAFFTMSYDLPVFSDPARISRLNLHEEGADYRLKQEQFNQAVNEALTPKLKLEDRAASLLVLAFLLLQLPVHWRSITVSRRRVLAYGWGVLIAYPALAINQAMRDYDRGLYPVWADSMGLVVFMKLFLDLLLLLVLMLFLYRTCCGMQGAGRIFRAAAALLGVSSLGMAVLSLWFADYVALACTGLLGLFFGWFLLGTQTRR